ncbi:hypothetical protein ACFYWX_07770, partial [Streptomyces sp. NPDC002888]|uniref:hypothetical protein n=1 Tax=Streptomyces sp. NPDC002888 TaxID=3364668 RepID=UPI00369DBFC6
AAMQAEGFVNLALPMPRFLRRRTTTPRACAHNISEGGMQCAGDLSTAAGRPWRWSSRRW